MPGEPLPASAFRLAVDKSVAGVVDHAQRLACTGHRRAVIGYYFVQRELVVNLDEALKAGAAVEQVTLHPERFNRGQSAQGKQFDAGFGNGGLPFCNIVQ
jgi:hypothetical protein